MKILRLFPVLLVAAITTGVTTSSGSGQDHTATLQMRLETETQKETYLGVFTTRVPDVLAAQFPDLLAEGQGIVVQGIVPGSPAELAAIRKHDVLVSYQQQEVESEAGLRARIRASSPGTEVRLGVLRSGKVRILKATLGTRPSRGSDEGAKSRARATSFGWVRSFASTTASGTPTTISIGLEAKNLTVRVSYVDRSGRRQERKASGSREEIARRLSDLPGALRGDVFHKLDEAAALREGNPLFSLRLRPFQTPQGEPRVRVSLFTLGKEGKVEAVTVDAAPEVDAITRHLERLPPKIRDKIVESLRQKIIPRMRVTVTRSL